MAESNVFVIGDVHGCRATFEELLGHWQPATERLVQVGDLVDRGRFSPECVALAISLEVRYPGQTVFLKGNHEAGMLQHFGPHGPHAPWLSWGGRSTVAQYRARPALLAPHLAWLSQRPLYWQNDHLLISHAGFADTPDPLDEANFDGVLWRRGPLRSMGRRQVIGHTSTTGQPTFDPITNVLNVDTGAVFGQCLTGVRLTATGELLAEIAIPTHPSDLPAA
ncbi:metallophosphoesterase [Hymenobacter yonginensis]|uniref:Metallophosphoesterase n=1 Tax=Hymenobacter yonginensis TaxID=748197 RepID=A0ABY7PH96_9BACT|nr:metallophosphoesterase [Hymenobacter yonginensis]WBO82832.1 metallophosphoesterase [Hymenobacter yonginensis]